MSSLLELTHAKLLWPLPDQIFQPSGAGPGIFAKLAEDKLGKAIRRECPDGADVKVGILTANQVGDDTEAPLAVICDFPNSISRKTLERAHQLAWSFSRSRALITVEPNQLRVWSCCEEPPENTHQLQQVTALSRVDLEESTRATLSEQAAASLHWIDLVSGHYFQENNQRFLRSRSADNLLLNNLKTVRTQLLESGLAKDTIHDLLARIIFIQFLFQRKDSSGVPALNDQVLKTLHQQNILSTNYQRLSEILSHHHDTYSLFRWLNEKFNGDLFPGKGETATSREAEWQAEEKNVTPQHLKILAEFVGGTLKMENGQRCLWPQYSFDAIPLDFISSIYEEFVRDAEPDKGVHYTPGHIVDFILDGVLPWHGDRWDIKILDPACGSGIFLVKAFQRLIYRWKQAHPGTEIKANDLKSLLVNNIFGVDINPHAVRVASFSLYLTICDEIDPRHYWRQVRFPRLRGHRLLPEDFFKNGVKESCSNNGANQYDLIIGNAPWGKNSLSVEAKTWAAANNWQTTYGNIGPLFLPKAAALTKPGGRIAMMQPSGVLIFNQINTAKEFRQKLFAEFQVEEIVNLSALRFGLFKDAVSPSCIVTLRVAEPDNTPVSYICPKPSRANEDDYRIVIEPQDINIINQSEVMNPLVWTALMWGGRRDLALVQRLNSYDNLEHYVNLGIAVKREGIKRGDRKKQQDIILNKRILKSHVFPAGSLLFLDQDKLPINEDLKTHSRDSTDYNAFALPQLIIKQSWLTSIQRFQAALTLSGRSKNGILCSESYISVHVPDESRTVLEAACLSYNSKLAVYYLLLSSGSFACYIPKPNVEDLMQVPIPQPQPGLLQHIENTDDVDQRIRKAFSFKTSEWALIEDLFEFTLPDFKGDGNSAGRKRTRQGHDALSDDGKEPELKTYCETFIRVMKAGFGPDKKISATVFQEQTRLLPVRLVAIVLDQDIEQGVRIELIDSPVLLSRLTALNDLFMQGENHKSGGIFYQRVARIYDTVQLTSNGRKTPVIYLVKPDRVRYWTRSMALRDADEVAADIMLWQQESSPTMSALQEPVNG